MTENTTTSFHPLLHPSRRCGDLRRPEQRDDACWGEWRGPGRRVHDVPVELRQGAVGAPAHFHTRATELFFVLDGALRVLVGEEVTVLRKGDFLAVPPHTAHAFAAAPGHAADVLFVFDRAMDRFAYLRLLGRVMRGRRIRRRSPSPPSGSTTTTWRAPSGVPHSTPPERGTAACARGTRPGPGPAAPPETGRGPVKGRGMRVSPSTGYSAAPGVTDHRRGCSPCPPPSSRPSTSRRRSPSPGLCGAT